VEHIVGLALHEGSTIRPQLRVVRRNESRKLRRHSRTLVYWKRQQFPHVIFAMMVNKIIEKKNARILSQALEGANIRRFVTRRVLERTSDPENLNGPPRCNQRYQSFS